MALFLKSTSNLKSVFEEKLGICQNLENTFKKLKNHLWCFVEKYLIGDSPKKTSREKMFPLQVLQRETLSNALEISN